MNEEAMEANTLVVPFEAMCRKYPDRTAVVYLGTTFSYSKLEELIERFAAGLSRLGVKEGDKVLMYIPNCPQWLIAYFGIQRLGAVPVPTTPIYTPYELAYIANDAQAKSIVCADTNFGYVRQILPQTPLKRVIVTNLADLLPGWKRAFGVAFDRVPRGQVARDERTYPFKGLLRLRHPHPPRAPETVAAGADSLAYLLYTGGTTGFPKGVPGTHGFLLSSILDMAETYKAHIKEGEHKLLLVLPLFHIFSQLIALATCLYLGNTLVLLPKVNIDAILESIQRYRVTLFVGVPTLYRMILEHDRLDLYDLSSLRYCFCGGDVLPLEVQARWRRRFDLPIYQVYGSTEVSAVSISPLDREPPTGSVGLPLASRTVQVVDPETLEPVPLGEVGELLVTTDWMIEGYWNKPEETAQAFVQRGGRTWYRMGDLVRMDEDGHLYFEERKADIIKYKGYRVAASEVEAVLQDHPAVVGACVIGVPDEAVGERIKAFVVLKEDAKGIAAHDLLRWCRERLTPYKVPSHIEFRDMLPKSKVGKLLRREMRDEERRRLGGGGAG